MRRAGSCAVCADADPAYTAGVPATDRLKLSFTAPVLIELADARHVDMPVSRAVASILKQETTIDDAIEALLTRPFRAEG